jgi:hypothetical protein
MLVSSFVEKAAEGKKCSLAALQKRLWKAEDASERLCRKDFGRQKTIVSSFAEKAETEGESEARLV